MNVEKLRINEVVVVEGRYDKIRLSSLLDAVIITTEGFGVFKDKEKQRLLRRLAAERGLLLLTDSDSAGFVIRSFLRGCIPKEQLKHAYIPRLEGKERRKTESSKEGLLGVEGMDTEVLLDALMRAGVVPTEQEKKEPARITKQRLLEDGFVGGENSASRRAELARLLELPETLTANALLEAINIVCTREDYERAAAQVKV